MFHKLKLFSLAGTAVAAGVLLAPSAPAQERRCKNNDDCDRQAFEAADKELTEFMPQALAFIDRFAAEATRETAKAELVQAQRHWIEFRDSTCKAEAAMAYLRSARTTEGFTASCLQTMTRQRLGELKKRFGQGGSD
jgi:uncharacterized protein YecT (DUF1311 family)